MPDRVIVFSAIPIQNNGYTYLLIRSHITKKEDIKKITDTIFNAGHFDFKGKLIFKDRMKAKVRLQELRLL